MKGWHKRHCECVFALFRYKNDEIFLGEKFQKMWTAPVSDFEQFSVKLWLPRRVSKYKFYDSAVKSGFRHYGPTFICAFPNMVKNGQIGQKPSKIPKFGWFESLIQKFWPRTTFWPILKPFRSKKVNFREIWKFPGFYHSKVAKFKIRPFWPIFGPKNLVLVTFY